VIGINPSALHKRKASMDMGVPLQLQETVKSEYLHFVFWF